MKKLCFTIAMGILFLVAGCATGEGIVKQGTDFRDYKRVAILPFEYKHRTDAKVEEYFEQELMTKGYELVERTKMQAILNEQQFQQSGLVDDRATAVQIGKLLNVDMVSMGTVTWEEGSGKSKEEVVITVKFVSVKDSSILYSASGQSESGGLVGIFGGIGKGLISDDKISSKMERVVKQTLKNLPPIKE
jgi:hypothetical protein